MEFKTDEYLYTVNEAAELLRVNKNYVYDLINKGYLQAIKLGRKKIPAFELKRFLTENLGNDFSDLNNIISLKTNDAS